MADKHYVVTARVGEEKLKFYVEAPNKVEAIDEAKSQVTLSDWDFMDSEVSVESEHSIAYVPLCHLLGQDLIDLVVEKFIEEALWTVKRVKA